MDGMQQEYWEQVAGPHWVAAQDFMDALLSPYAEVLRAPLRRHAREQVVDVGCGCGATTLIARQEAPSAAVLAVDVSGPMLAAAEKRARSAGDQQTRFVHADAATYPLPQNSVDLIISRFGLMFFADPAAAFRHMNGWLKPDGRIATVVWSERAENPWMTEVIAVVTRMLQVPASDEEAPGPFSLGRQDRRRSLFQQAGLSIEEEHRMTEPLTIRGTIDELVTFYGARGPISVALAQAEPSERDRALTALRKQIEALYEEGGVTLPACALQLTLRAST